MAAAPGVRRQQVLEQVGARIRELVGQRPTLVAIDGVDGAGKTVFADELTAVLTVRGIPVLRASVDGFHHPRNVRHRRGRHSSDGFYLDSYDYPALRACLLEPLRTGGDRRIRRAVYDVAREGPVVTPTEEVDDRTVLVLDGIFLHRPELRHYWHLSVFLRVPFDISIPRGNARFGGDPDPAASVNRRYVQGQQRYLEGCRPERHATLVIDNSELTAPRFVRTV